MGNDTPDVDIHHGPVEEVYDEWDGPPQVIISDGAYGTGGFETDPSSPADLTEWYRDHVRKWSEQCDLGTTLWFWCTEIGWAEVHPLLKEHGWEYRGCNIWNKGIQHIAGNSNTQSMRRFPPVTEVCVQYKRSGEKYVPDRYADLREWLRGEWKRAGLDFTEANEACGVQEAASRKYFGNDWQWYFPPPERFQQLVDYANENGNPSGRPYFEVEEAPTDVDAAMQNKKIEHRTKFDLEAGVTNVWKHPQVSGTERVDDTDGIAHPNQKPVELMQRIIKTTTDPGDMVWEPFGGLCTGTVAAKRLNRRCRAAEIDDEYYDIAMKRVAETKPQETAIETEQAGLKEFRTGG